MPAAQACTHLCCIHNAHVHAGQARVVQESAVEGAANSLVATEGERDVGHATADLGTRAHALDLASCAEEVHGIVVVLGQACADSEDVGVKDDVLWLKAHLLDQDAVCTLAHAHLQQQQKQKQQAAEVHKFAVHAVNALYLHQAMTTAVNKVKGKEVASHR